MSREVKWGECSECSDDLIFVFEHKYHFPKKSAVVEGTLSVRQIYLSS
jgi:hypothetical protein